MFNVAAGATLNLENGVKMSGKSMTGGDCTYSLKKGWEQESLSGTYHPDPTEFVFIANKNGNRKSLKVESDGTVTSTDANNLYNSTTINPKDFADQIYTLNYVKQVQDGNTDSYVYTAKNNATGKYLVFDKNENGRRGTKITSADAVNPSDDNIISTITFRKTGVADPCAEFITNSEHKYIQIENRNDDVFAYWKVNKTPFEMYRIEGNCSPAEIDDAIYNKADLGNASEGGFFVQNNGNLNINGAVFKDFVTTEGEDAPNKVAPIYNGNGSTFEMTSGEIVDNSVSYGTSNKGSLPSWINDENVSSWKIWRYFKGAKPSWTAGAIIFDGVSKATISGDSKIANNKGDVGAIAVLNSNVNLNGGNIQGNKGVLLGGAIYVNGDKGKGVTMNGGDISNNQTIRRGGAVTSEWSNKAKEGGRFTLNNGEIHDNYTYGKGGALRVRSNEVSLNGGKIYNNKSRVMGGAIYVDGDSPRSSACVVINNGSIYHNKAVGADVPELGGKTDRSFGNKKGYLQPGCGGGVWTCPYGTMVINFNKVYIDANEAAHGKDYHKDNGLSGAIIIDGAMSPDCVNEDGGKIPGVIKPFNGEINITNTQPFDKTKIKSGVQIYDNISRRGGGIGANGTVIFGDYKDQTFNRSQAFLTFTKKWDGIDADEQLYFDIKFVAPDKTESDLGIHKLTGNNDTAEEFDEQSIVKQTNPWTLQISLPNALATKKGEVDLYDKDGNITKGCKILVNEVKGANDSTALNTYKYELSDVELKSKETVVQKQSITDKSGNTYTTTINFDELQYELTGTNSKKPEKPEEYEINISKADISGNEIEGANIELSKDGKVVESWTSGKTAHKVNLKPGKYVFKETLAPEGFEVVTDITFTVNADGTVTVNDKQAKVNDNGVLVVTDNYSTEKTKVDVTKTWVGKAADQIKLILKNGTETVKEVIVKAKDNWKHTFSDLFKYDQKTGKKINYTVEEEAIDGYDSSITGNAKDGFTVTNTKKVHEIEISKADIDGNEIEGAKIELSKDGKVVDSWTSEKTNHKVNLKPGEYVFKETLAPEGFDVVTEITFTVGKDGKVAVDNKQAKVNKEGVLVVTDNYSTEKITVNVNKKWIGAEADKATVKLMADGKEVKTADLTKKNGWKASFTDLFKYDQKTGKKINYTVEEEAIDGYDSSITGNAKDGFTVTNTKKVHEIEISKADIDGNEIEGAEIELSKDGKVVDSWTSEKTNHKVNLKPGGYVFKETLAPEGFDVVTEITFTVGKDGKVAVDNKHAEVNKEGVLVVTDNYSTEKITVDVDKKWIGAEADKATVKLLADGKEVKTADLTKKNGWKASFTDLFKYDQKTGKKITYTVAEVANDAYTSKVDGNAKDGFTITNTKKVHEIEISKADIDGNEIEGAKIELRQGGKVIDSWTSEKTNHKVNLKPGEYVFKETLAPEGFDVVTDITFTVNVDGTVKVTDKQAEVNKDGVLVVTDNYIEKPYYKEGTIKTIVEAGGSKGSSDKAAKIVINGKKSVQTINDTVYYEGLFAGKEYRLIGTVMDVSKDGSVKAIASTEKIFIPQSANGTVNIEFKDVPVQAGHKYVVFEKAISIEEFEFKDENGKNIKKHHEATHEDVNDKAETVLVSERTPEKIKTGDQDWMYTGIYLGSAAGLLLLLLLRKKYRRNR